MTHDLAPEPSVLVWGAGAIGGVIGAHLVRAGRNVTFVDLDEAHLAAIRSGHLRITGPVENFAVGGQAFTPTELHGLFDIVLLAVKSQHTPAALAQLAPHLSPDGVVVSCQNGLNELVIEQTLGRARTVGCYVGLPADRMGPGAILYGRRGELAIGALDGLDTPMLEGAARVLRDFYPDLEVTPHIMDHLWSKMAFVCVLAAGTVTGDTTADFLRDMSVRPVWTGLVREIMAIADTQGVSPVASEGFDPDACIRNDATRIQQMVDVYIEKSRGSTKERSGIWRDLAVHKRKTEIPAQFGPIIEMGSRNGVEAPIMSGLLRLIEEIESGERSLGPEQAGALRALV